jgi:hypothetical protein
MKKLVLLFTAFMLICASPVFAGNAPDTVISQEALMNMDNHARNALFEGLKKQAQLKEVQPAISPENMKTLAAMDIETFRGKTMAIADTIVDFFDKLGVKANEFIFTPVGILTAIGIIYKLGVFEGIWSSFIGTIFIITFLILLYKLNTKKIITLNKTDASGVIFQKQDVLVPKFSAISGDDDSEISFYACIGSLVCVFVIVVTALNMW